MKESNRWKKILPELLAVILCLGIMCVGVSFKEGYHMDELLSFELANARYNPWIVPTQPEGRLAKFVREEIQGDSFPETVSNLTDTVKDALKMQTDIRIKRMSMRNRYGSRRSSSGIMLPWMVTMPLTICRSILM